MSNKLALTKKMLESAPSVREMFEINAVRQNSIATLQDIFGMPEDRATRHFEAQLVAYQQAIINNPKLATCTKFSHYNAMMELFLSGVSLTNQESCLIPYKDVVQFQVMWQGRLTQMHQIPDIKYVSEPELVYEEDDFQFEKGPDGLKIISHTPMRKRTNDNLEYVYMYIDYHSVGRKYFMMERKEVLNIRDTYSKTYKDYIKKKNAGQLQGWEEVPMWISSEGQAWKKTLVKRVYKMQKKTAIQVAIDERMEIHAAKSGISDVDEEVPATGSNPGEVTVEQVKSVFIDDEFDHYEEIPNDDDQDQASGSEEVQEVTPEPEKPKSNRGRKPKTEEPKEEPKSVLESQPTITFDFNNIDPNESF